MYLNKKTIIISILLILIPLMAVGYSLLNESLIISGTSHIDSNWQVEIIGITESDIVGDATDKVSPSYTATTANFRVSLINPTDSITYNIKIKNLGTLAARIKKIDVDIGNSDAIEYEVKCNIDNGTYEVCDETHFKNQVLEPNKEQIVKIKVSFKEGYIGQPSQANSTNNIRVRIDYVQNFEANGTQILPPEEIAYSVGDMVSFAGSNWYVIEDSPSGQDYVVLIKGSNLTSDELTTNYEVLRYGTSKTGCIAYYWSDTCHWANVKYGNSILYTDNITSGCINSYETSKVKEFLEGIYINVLDESKLKSINTEGNNYKIRMITINEYNFLYNSGNDYSGWLYGPSSYWTMTSSIRDYQAYFIKPSGQLRADGDLPVYSIGVRPVINLYKNAISN